MQAVILAAGRSSRFFPFATDSHKSEIKILGKTIIEHTVLSIKKAGIAEIIIVTSKESKIKDILGSGKELGVNIEYATQDAPIGGGNGLLSAKDLIKGDFFLLYPHRVDFSEYKDLLEAKNKTYDNVLLVRKGGTSSKYGFIKVEADKVVDLIEKPKESQDHSGLRVVGIYLFNKNFLSTLEETDEEEYQLENAISKASKQGKVGFVETNREVPTLKYSYDLLGLKNYLLKKMMPQISKEAKIDKTVLVQGDVFIDEGAEISENVSIKGPCYIGKDVYIGTGSLVREGSVLEEGSKVGAFSEIKNSLFGSGSSVHSGYIGDSVIGENCKMGVFACTSNVRLDREGIKVELPTGEVVETDLTNLGAIIGNKVTLGVRVTLMPGVLVGEKSVVGPFSIVMKSIGALTTYYSKFDQIIEKPRKV